MKKYLIVIPARGGSKGVIRKNIYPVLGKPMISYTINLLKNINLEADIAISTDDEEIGIISRECYGDDSRFTVIQRPEEYATDIASTEDVVIHALDYMRGLGKEYSVVITMAPNLPLRTKEMFEGCVDSFEKMPAEFDSQVCFLKTTDDFWRKCNNNEFIRLFPNNARRRQDREPLYIEKGSITMTKVNALYSSRSLWGNKIYGYEISEENSVDVHDIDDIYFLEYLLSK